MVRLTRLLPVVIALAAALLPISCEFFAATPFPEFLSYTDASVDLTGLVSSIVGEATSARYDLAVVSRPGLEPRVILLVEPPSFNEETDFLYEGAIVVLDAELNVIGEMQPLTAFDYFGRPFAYAHDGNILISYMVITPQADGFAFDSPLETAKGIEGYAVANDTETYLFAQPSGDYAAFDLRYIAYRDSGGAWGEILSEATNSLTLNIISDDAVPSSDASNFDQLGFQLIGLSYNQGTDEVTFLLSVPSEGVIVGARTTLADATADPGGNVLLPDAEWPIEPQQWPIYVDADRPDLHVDSEGFFLLRRDGWLDRFAWTQAGELGLVDSDGAATDGPVIRIVGDRYLSRQYAFLVQSDGDDYMYRFDESSAVLTRYRRWW